jgi:hypothetical protein
MRMKLVVLIVVILFPGLAAASCANPTDHVDERQCLKNEVSKLSREVLAAQQLVRTRIAAWDQELSYKSRTLTLFDKAAIQFHNFLARQCEFEASVAAGGNGASDMRHGCQIELYRSYLKSLQEQASRLAPPHA